MNKSKSGGGATTEQAFTPISLAEARLAKLKAIPFDRSKYEVVRDLARLKAWIVRAIEHGHVAIDTETNSLDPMQAALCGFSLAVTPNEACYVPLSHKKNGGSEGLFDAGLEPHQIPEKDALETIKPLLEDPGVLKIGQNLKFDWQIFAQRGITIAPYDDTLLMSYVVDAGRSDHGLGPLARRYFDHTVIDYNEVTKAGKTRVTFDCVEISKAAEYAAEDADVTLRLWHILKPRLAAERMTNVYEIAGASAGRSTGAHGRPRHCHRPEDTREIVERVRQRIRAARSRHPEACRPAAQSRLAEAARRRAVRIDGAAGRHQDQDRAMVHRRQGARRPGRTGPQAAAGDPRLAAGVETALDLYRRAADLCRSENAARAYELLARGHHHRPAVVVRAESAEHPDPHRGRAARSAAPSSPRRATSWCRPIIRRSNCVCSPKSRTCRRCVRPSRTASTFTR